MAAKQQKFEIRVFLPLSELPSQVVKLHLPDAVYHLTQNKYSIDNNIVQAVDSSDVFYLILHCASVI